MQSILEGLSNLLTQHPHVEPNSGYVRFLRFGTSSLDLEVFAYVMARNWKHFLEVQGELLLRSMEAVQATGAQIALQAPIYVAPTAVFQSEQQQPDQAKNGTNHETKHTTT
jgi:MscS family membrane protein